MKKHGSILLYSLVFFFIVVIFVSWKVFGQGTQYYGPTQNIAAGTAVMTTVLITAPACGTTVTVPAPNVAATDTITWAFSAAPAATNMGLVAWPTPGNVNFAYCTGVTETPAAATINWSVKR